MRNGTASVFPPKNFSDYFIPSTTNAHYRYARAKEMLECGYNLHADIFGTDPADPLTKAASRAKASEDAKSSPKS